MLRRRRRSGEKKKKKKCGESHFFLCPKDRGREKKIGKKEEYQAKEKKNFFWRQAPCTVVLTATNYCKKKKRKCTDVGRFSPAPGTELREEKKKQPEKRGTRKVVPPAILHSGDNVFGLEGEKKRTCSVCALYSRPG